MEEKTASIYWIQNSTSYITNSVQNVKGWRFFIPSFLSLLFRHWYQLWIHCVREDAKAYNLATIIFKTGQILNINFKDLPLNLLKQDKKDGERQPISIRGVASVRSCLNHLRRDIKRPEFSLCLYRVLGSKPNVKFSHYLCPLFTPVEEGNNTFVSWFIYFVFICGKHSKYKENVLYKGHGNPSFLARKIKAQEKRKKIRLPFFNPRKVDTTETRILMSGLELSM